MNSKLTFLILFFLVKLSFSQEIINVRSKVTWHNMSDSVFYSRPVDTIYNLEVQVNYLNIDSSEVDSSFVLFKKDSGYYRIFKKGDSAYISYTSKKGELCESVLLSFDTATFTPYIPHVYNQLNEKHPSARGLLKYTGERRPVVVDTTTYFCYVFEKTSAFSSHSSSDGSRQFYFFDTVSFANVARLFISKNGIISELFEEVGNVRW